MLRRLRHNDDLILLVVLRRRLVTEVELPRGEGLVVEYLGVFEPKRTFFFFGIYVLHHPSIDGMRTLLERSHIRADVTSQPLQSQCSLQRFDAYRTASAW